MSKALRDSFYPFLSPDNTWKRTSGQPHLQGPVAASSAQLRHPKGRHQTAAELRERKEVHLRLSPAFPRVQPNLQMNCNSNSLRSRPGSSTPDEPFSSYPEQRDHSVFSLPLTSQYIILSNMAATLLSMLFHQKKKKKFRASAKKQFSTHHEEILMPPPSPPQTVLLLSLGRDSSLSNSDTGQGTHKRRRELTLR